MKVHSDGAEGFFFHYLKITYEFSLCLQAPCELKGRKSHGDMENIVFHDAKITFSLSIAFTMRCGDWRTL